jgi:hypothetical protein
MSTGGTGYDPENRDPDYSKFTEWLQCYYKDGMKNMADHNKRTMWYQLLFLEIIKGRIPLPLLFVVIQSMELVSIY